MDWKKKQLEFGQTHKMFMHCRRAEGVAGIQLMLDFALPLQTQVWITWVRCGGGIDQKHIFTVMASVPAVHISSLAKEMDGFVASYKDALIWQPTISATPACCNQHDWPDLF